jgi:hypothetical protein
MLKNCNEQTFLVLLALTLVIAFMNNIDRLVPQLRNVFNNKVNLALLCVIVICVVLLNVPIGIMLIFVVLYMDMFYKNKKTLSANEAFQNNHLHQQVLNLVADESPPFNQGANANSHTTHQQNQVEIKKAVKQLPKNPQTADPVSESVSAALRGPILKNQEKDLLTQTFNKDRSGYDVAGCRYDMKQSPQNLTINGPPVSQCGNYSKEKMDKVGCAFYPLNH